MIRRQEEDRVRFAHKRMRKVPVRISRFTPGQYVRVWQKPVNKLDVNTTRALLRVRTVEDKGTLILEDGEGKPYRAHIEFCTPTSMDDLQTPAGEAARTACHVCNRTTLASPILLCDNCPRGYHMECLQPPLQQVPVGNWYCPRCVAGQL